VTGQSKQRPEGPTGERAAGPAGERAVGPAGERAAGPAGERAVGPAGERGPDGPRISGLAIAPVKGTRLLSVEALAVGRCGVRENRRFFLVDERRRMVNAKDLGALQSIVSAYDDDRRRLSLTFPDGRTLEGEVSLDGELTASFYGRPLPARAVAGEWSAAISEHVGRRLQLVEAGECGAVDRGRAGAFTLISRGSLERLAERAGCARVDVRRFRMLIELDGVDAHAEDGWVGRTIRAGDAVLRARGHVGRCVITNRDPDSGEVTLQTLRILSDYRRQVNTTEPIAFGIHGEVLEPGTIRVGDAVTLA